MLLAALCDRDGAHWGGGPRSRTAPLRLQEREKASWPEQGEGRFSRWELGWGKRHGTMSSCQPSHVTVEVCRLKGSDPRGKGVDRLLGLRSYRCGVGVLTKG